MKYVITRYVIKSPKVKEKLTAVLVTDLHNADYGRNNKGLLAACKEEKPDLILAAGDMLIGNALYDREAGLHFMQSLPGIAPTFCANGNHERRLKAVESAKVHAYSSWISALEKSGVQVVNNRSAALTIKGTKIALYGADLPLRLYRKFRRPRIRISNLTKNLGLPMKDNLNILIAHNPEFTEEYLDWGADLAVSGHYHGGLVRLPFSGRALLSPYGYFLPKYGVGHFERNGRHAVVSAGLGDHAIPLRIFDPRELVVIRLIPVS
ncbi:MAG: metallophosphoesterase [Lachnospiraceae bacterium]|nr:metallophosphoesterase [Lachnospiraceae bacterium]